MSSSTGSFDLAALFAERSVSLATLGAAYLILIATAVLTVLAFYTARSQLVISPNRGSRDYGVYVTSALAALLIAIVLENESLPAGSATLHYAFVPQIVALLSLHVWISYRLEPWLVTLGASAAAATIAVGVLLGVTTGLVGPAYWVALSVLGMLLAFLWWKAISTQRAFVNASSIIFSPRRRSARRWRRRSPWLGLRVGRFERGELGCGVANSLRKAAGSKSCRPSPSRPNPACVAVTALVCVVPAGAYWVTRKAWMPELTRFVWLAWIVVGFALTYGNYLSSLAPT
jgi:hypothetical protein